MCVFIDACTMRLRSVLEPSVNAEKSDGYGVGVFMFASEGRSDDT